MFAYISEGKPDEFGSVLEAGIYPAIVIKAEEKTSKKSGNPMLELHLRCLSEEGKTSIVREYLINTQNMIWKIDRLLWATGRNPQSGSSIQIAPHELIGNNIYVRVGIEHGAKMDFNTCEEVMSEAEALVLIDAMKRRPVSAQQLPRQAAKPPYASASRYDDDIPF